MTTLTITVPDWFASFASLGIVIWLVLYAVHAALKAVKLYYERKLRAHRSPTQGWGRRGV